MIQGGGIASLSYPHPYFYNSRHQVQPMGNAISGIAKLYQPQKALALRPIATPHIVTAPSAVMPRRKI